MVRVIRLWTNMRLAPAVVFLGAFLLFSIQPIIAKVILPWFGGTASVWTTCLLFFQIELLLGYLYTDILVRRLKSRPQGGLHIALLGVSLLWLPLAPATPASGDPTARILMLLAGTIGLPYLMLASTAPLVQSWVARTNVSPYRLYALSNLASMLALLGYPFVAEPFLTLGVQKGLWSAGYALFVAGCGYMAWISRKLEPEERKAAVKPPAKQMAVWLILAAAPCVLMMAVTNQLCQNLAAIPFLWVLPLSLYLLTFIIAFQSPAWLRGNAMHLLLGLGLGMLAYGLSDTFAVAPLALQISILPAGMTLVCLFCHGELANRKPVPSQLTGFYLAISLGGAIGGLLVGLAAPRFLGGFFEMPIAIAACAVVGAFLFYGTNLITDIAWMVIAAVLVAQAATRIRGFHVGLRAAERNFYGVLTVSDRAAAAGVPANRSMAHGSIEHGCQFLEERLRRNPTTYYGRESGAALALRLVKQGPLRAGFVGLGAGTLATYGRQGDVYRFYEINPAVIRFAQSEFTFLRDSAAKIEMVDGDARISLQNESPGNFDVLVVDAFTGDAVPIHLLTLEAFRLYLRHLRDDGVLALHISNHYLDLAPVVERLGRELGKDVRRVVTTGEKSERISPSEWMLVSSNQGVLSGLPKPAARKAPLWTDDYCNQFGLLK